MRFLLVFEGAMVFMLPIGLVSKRRCSRKYPICLVVKRSDEERRSAALQSQEASLADASVRNLCCSVLDVLSDNTASTSKSSSAPQAPSTTCTRTCARSIMHFTYSYKYFVNNKSHSAENLACVFSVLMPSDAILINTEKLYSYGYSAGAYCTRILVVCACARAAVNNAAASTPLLSPADVELLSRLQNMSLAEYELVLLFGRTALEKETWFYRLQAAARGAPYVQSLLEIVPGAGLLTSSASAKRASTGNLHAAAAGGGGGSQQREREANADAADAPAMHFRAGIEEELLDAERRARHDSVDLKAKVSAHTLTKLIHTSILVFRAALFPFSNIPIIGLR